MSVFFNGEGMVHRLIERISLWIGFPVTESGKQTSRFAVQLYTLRDMVKKNMAEALKKTAQLGFKGVEFAGLYDNDPQDVRKMLDDLGLLACGMHCAAFDQTQSERNMETAHILGCQDIIDGAPEEQFESEEKIRELADKINAVVDRCSRYGFNVGYHNHWYEFDAPNKGDLLFSLCPGLRVQFDIYWIATGGANPEEYLKKYAGRVRSIHIKDGPCLVGKPMTALGRGQLNIKAALKTAGGEGIQWAIVEIDQTEGDIVECLKESFDYLVTITKKMSRDV